ncbi:uncharacterized protein LOC131630421 [Vicia villosa]|uniref:uncharacterized protein LOC131630421 n=1 Tax=Vicia villosa TaxID=3911 RepID=UPI00273CAAA2|nr:uncharacterized protein LOC131630421 [Vicia villosa]
MTDSDIDWYNTRLQINKESMVAKTVKDSIFRLGLVCMDPEEEAQLNIEVMEKRDNEGMFETKLPSFNLKLSEEFWGAKDVEWTHLDSNGALGGSVILWRKNLIDLISSYKGTGFVGLKARLNGLCINFINVCAPCNAILRREVWKNLLRLKNSIVGEDRCIGGDFNSVMFKEERLGKSAGSCGKDSIDFLNFVEEMELIYLPCVGGRFTWFSGNGCAMSRLDRFFISDNLALIWKLDNQVVGKRVLSDHCPVWLKAGGYDWGPKPFRFFKGWYKHKNLDSFMKKEWNLLSVKGGGDFVMYEKLKRLKVKFKVWNKEVFGWIDLRIDEKVEKQYDLD